MAEMDDDRYDFRASDLDSLGDVYDMCAWVLQELGFLKPSYVTGCGPFRTWISDDNCLRTTHYYD